MEMEEVKFVTDSDILLPESERELKELLAMLQENPDYRIRIHGHANGDHAREITSLGESSNFFSSDSAFSPCGGAAAPPTRRVRHRHLDQNRLRRWHRRDPCGTQRRQRISVSENRPAISRSGLLAPVGIVDSLGGWIVVQALGWGSLGA